MRAVSGATRGEESASPLDIHAAARAAPERIAIVDDAGRELSYHEMSERAAAWEGRLAELGVAREGAKRIAIVPRNTPDCVACVYACMAMAVPMVLIHPRSTPAERAHASELTSPALVLDFSELVESPSRRPPPEPAAPDELSDMCLIFTSGTTGSPKAARLSRRAFVAAARASEANLGWREHDRWILSIPLAHVGGLSIVVRCLAARKTVVLFDRSFDVDSFISHLQSTKTTIASLVPTMLDRILDGVGRDGLPHALHTILLGGAAAGPKLVNRASQLRARVLTTYGLTEACAQVTTLRAESPLEPDVGAGHPLPGIEVRIADDSEIYVRGENLFSGYLSSREVASPIDSDGWLHTGDFGRLDANGRLHVLSRRSDLIISGGENIYPAELEVAMSDLEEVAEACVFGVDHPKWGEVPAVAVVVTPGASVTAEGLLAHLAKRVARHKLPRKWAIVPHLPLNRMGKVDRKTVRESYAERLVALRD